MWNCVFIRDTHILSPDYFRKFQKETLYEINFMFFFAASFDLFYCSKSKLQWKKKREYEIEVYNILLVHGAHYYYTKHWHHSQFMITKNVRIFPCRISMETAAMGGMAGFQYIAPNHIIKTQLNWTAVYSTTTTTMWQYWYHLVETYQDARQCLRQPPLLLLCAKKNDCRHEYEVSKNQIKILCCASHRCQICFQNQSM